MAKLYRVTQSKAVKQNGAIVNDLTLCSTTCEILHVRTDKRLGSSNGFLHATMTVKTKLFRGRIKLVDFDFGDARQWQEERAAHSMMLEESLELREMVPTPAPRKPARSL
jgi:hypothetical protein